MLYNSASTHFMHLPLLPHTGSNAAAAGTVHGAGNTQATFMQEDATARRWHMRTAMYANPAPLQVDPWRD